MHSLAASCWPTEGVSEASSDLENRIRVLTDELARRKREAEQLKREQRRSSKAKLREREESLRKQIDAYDQLISQQRLELQDSEPRPLIKQPTAAEKTSTSSTQKDSGDGERTQQLTPAPARF